MSTRASRRRMPRVFTLGLAVTGLGVPGTVQGQDRLELRVSPLVGALNPSGDWGGARFLDSGNLISYPELGAQAVAGVAVTLSATGTPWALRLEGLRSFGDRPVGTWTCPPGVACPAILIRVPTEMHAWVGAADVIVRPEPRWNAVQLHGLAGAAWISYDFSWDPEAVGSFSLEPGSADRGVAALHLGIGASRDFGRATLDVEVSGLVTGDPGEEERGPRHVALVQTGVSLPIGTGS